MTREEELEERLHLAEMEIKLIKTRLLDQTINFELAKLHAVIERGVKNSLAHALTMDRRKIDSMFTSQEE